MEEYKSKKSLAEQFAEARKVPKAERENFEFEDRKQYEEAISFLQKDGKYQLSSETLKAIKDEKMTVSEAYKKGMLHLEMTKDAKYGQNPSIQKQIEAKKQEALIRSQQDSTYDYFVRVSEQEGVLLEKIEKEQNYWNHLKESTSKVGEGLGDAKEALYHTGAWVVEHGKFLKNPNTETHNSSLGEGKKALQNVGNAVSNVGEGFTLGIGSKLGERTSNISAGSVQYGSQEEVFGRKEALYDKTKGRTDVAVVTLTAPVAEKMISKAVHGNPSSVLRKQLESLGIQPEVKTLGIQIDGTTKTGLEIDKALGNNLGTTFKTFDHFEDGVATSVKSVNLNAKSYQEGSQMYHKLNKDLKAIEGFTEYKLQDTILKENQIDTRILKIVVNDQKLNPSQVENTRKIVESAKQKGIIVEAVIIE